jgi:membrane-associated phospholipid phosphatase
LFSIFTRLFYAIFYAVKKYFLLLCMLGAAAAAFGESVYSCDLKTDLVAGAAAVGLAITPFFIHSAADRAERDVSLSRDSVNAFDQPLMFAYNKPADIFSYAAVAVFAALPFAPLWENVRDANVWAAYCVMYAESALLVFGTTEIMKNAILRYRPYCYFDDSAASEHYDYFQSFPSRHTAFAFLSAGFFTSAFCAEYPDSPWKLPLGTAAYAAAAGIGLSRIFSGNHFAADVLAGAAIGALFGYALPWLHLRGKPGTIALAPQPNGFLVKLCY